MGESEVAEYLSTGCSFTWLHDNREELHRLQNREMARPWWSWPWGGLSEEFIRASDELSAQEGRGFVITTSEGKVLRYKTIQQWSIADAELVKEMADE